MPACPPLATRFSSDNQPANPGRTPTKRIREILSERDEGGVENRDAIVKHLIEVATRWEVKVVGRDGDGEVLKVASGKDAVAAAQLLMAYDFGAPPKGGTVKVPPGATGATLDIALAAYRARLIAGELDESELPGLVATLSGAERDKAMIFIKAMGPRLHTLKSEQVDAMMRDYDADPQKFLGMNPPEPTEGELKP